MTDNIYENPDLRVAIFWEDDDSLSGPFETHDDAAGFLSQSDRPGHVIGYREGEREEAIEFAKELNHPLWKRGLDVGESIGHSRAVHEAIRAYEMGELELWLEAMTPKSMEGWHEWEEKHGKNFSDRWKSKSE
jgi:hypothetical protein